MDQDSKLFKRTAGDFDGPSKKRNRDYEGEDKVAIKVLIPQIAVGAIIGKGGESIQALKQDYHCNVTMSRNNETYPGTSERICLVKGTINNSLQVLRCLMERIYDKCRDETYAPDAFDFANANRGSEMKLVMPNTSAGLIIGKAGANIKEIKETYDVQIQVHPKAGSYEAKTSLERVVVIANDDLEKLIDATEQVLTKVASDPGHTKMIERDDDKMNTPARAHQSPPYQNFQATPVASNMGSLATMGGAGYGYNNAPYQPQQQQFGTSMGQRFQFTPTHTMSNNDCMAFLEQLQAVLRESGFSEASISEIMSALHVLAKYNIMALGLGFGVVAMAQFKSGQQAQNPPSNHGSAGYEFPGGQGQGQNYQWNR